MERRLKQVYRLVFPDFIPNFWAVVPFLLAYFIFQQYGTWEVFKFTVSGLLVHWIVYSLLICIFAYLPNRNWVSRLWIICLWLYLWLFLIIGLIDFGSNLFWHRPVSFRLAVVGYYEISKLPMRGFYNKYYILGILTLAMGLSLGIYWSYSTHIFTHLRRSTKTICHHAQVLGKQPFAWFGVIIIVSVVWMNINFFRYYVYYYLASKDPLTSSVYASFYPADGISNRLNGILDTAYTPLSISLNDSPKNIVIICIDDLRADHTPTYGYHIRPTMPFWDSLTKTENWRNIKMAISASNFSDAGILEILHGKSWTQMNKEHNFGIQDMLHAQGFKTTFITSGFHRDWYRLGEHYGTHLDVFYDGTDAPKRSAYDDKLVLDALDALHFDTNRRHFLYIHLMSVHVSGIRHPEFERYLPNHIERDAATEALRKIVYINNYDNGILQVDDMLKHIIDKLKQTHILPNALLIVTADHGENLGERGIYGHVKGLWFPQMHIPCWIYDVKGFEKYNNLNFITHIDFAPTIATRLGLMPHRSWQGLSILDTQPPVRFTHHWQENEKAIYRIEADGNIWKYMYNQQNQQEYLYNLKEDINEVNNLNTVISKDTLQIFRNQIKQHFNIGIQ